MHTPRDKARRTVEDLEHDEGIIAKRRQLLLKIAKDVVPKWRPNPHLKESDDVIALIVNPALADYFEKYEIYPITRKQKEDIYLGYYAAAAKHFFYYLKR